MAEGYHDQRKCTDDADDDIRTYIRLCYRLRNVDVICSYYDITDSSGIFPAAEKFRGRNYRCGKIANEVPSIICVKTGGYFDKYPPDVQSCKLWSWTI